jgi:uncharacterized protein
VDTSDRNTPSAIAGDEPESNPSSNPWFTDIVERRYRRRDVVKGGVAVTGHEGAWIAPVRIGKPIVVYMGDDARGEYV